MKNIHSCFVIILLFFTTGFGVVSCTSDATTPIPKQQTVSYKTEKALPSYSNNPYDDAGWLHTELLQIYHLQSNNGGAVTQILEDILLIANTNTAFNSIKGSSYTGVSSGRIQYILDHQSTCVSDIISSSSMSNSAKLSLTDFITSFDLFFNAGNESDDLYQKVVDYETTVLQNSGFTSNDKRIILTTTAITRHSSYLARKKPKKNTDPDWTILIGNIVAAVDGAEDSTANAVVAALVAGIAQND
jgi:hypothetical protein